MALSLMVAGVERISSLRANSLRLTTTADAAQGVLDFEFLNRKPSIDQTVVLSDGATTYYDGHVRAYSTSEVKSGTWYCTVSCQDDAGAIGGTPSAPYNLSDTPNYTTTFPYVDLKMDVDGARGASYVSTTTTGTVSTWRAGLAPGQMIEITSANNSLSAASYRIMSMDVTWPDNKTPFYTIKFGDSPIRLKDTLVSQIGGTNFDAATNLSKSLNVPVVVTSLPALPSAVYTVGKIAYLTTDGKLYRAGADNLWHKELDGADLIVSSITAGAIAAGAVGAEAIAVGSITADRLAVGGVGTGNLLRNGSFEDADNSAHTIFTEVSADLRGWTIDNGAMVKFPSSAYAKTGSYVAGVYSAYLTANPLIYQDVPVVAGRTYRVNSWMWKTATGTLPAFLHVSTLNAAKSVVATSVIDLSRTATTPAKLTGSYTVPSDGTVSFLRVLIGLYGTPVDLEGAFFEDVELVSMSGTTEIIDGSITTGKIAASAVTADKISANSIGIGQMRDAGSNLVPNPGFELDGDTAAADPLTGWTLVPGDEPQWQTSAGAYRNGTYSLRGQQKATPEAVQVISDRMPAVPGARYRVRAWTRGINTNSATAKSALRALWYTAAGAYISSTLASAYTVGTGLTWVELTSVVTSPTNAAFGQVQLENNSASAANDVVYFDDVEFYRADADVSHAGGYVAIDSTGITVTNGAITVSNAGATVIIDGSSDMFKIGAQGTGSVSVPASGMGTASGYQDFTLNLSFAPAFLYYVSTASDTTADKYDRLEIPTQEYVAATSGGAVTTSVIVNRNYTFFASRYSSASVSRVLYQAKYTGTGSALTYYFKFYVLLEAAM